MELIIVLAIVGMIIAYLVMQRRKETTVAEQPAVGQPYLDPAAPYKVETPAPVVEAVVEVAPVVATVEVAALAVVEEPVSEKPAPKARKPKAVVAETPAVEAVKKPRKPRSKKV